jgi:transcriptional regulator with XRE-family HTH domain
MTMRNKDQSSLYREIGSRIRVTREKLDLTQAQLVDGLDLSRTSLVNIESGRQQPPLHTLWDIAKALNLEVHDLIPKAAEIASETIGQDLNDKVKHLIQSSTEGDEAQARITEFVASVKSETRS